MSELNKKEQERLNRLKQIDRYLIDPRDHVLRSFDGRSVMKEKTVPVIAAIMVICAVLCAVFAFTRPQTQKILLFAAAAFFVFYGVRYWQYYMALKGK